ncbi:hypothetical protein A9Q99_25045 [Gammaproteobacteria bacterium 45_16_T64]|nr:hypothetical protein A9Q99_25045 [Gammaproteobacteria bacterium 45_16_T64]
MKTEKNKITTALRDGYLNTMMGVIARSLCAMSKVDDHLQYELSVVPDNFVLQMKVLPNVAGFAVKKNSDGHLEYLGKEPGEKADVTISIKHPELAYLVFSFQENTAEAFARNRTIIEGDLAMAMRLIRCINWLEVFILPKAAAEKALKRYPDISFKEKSRTASKIYGRLALDMLNWSAA